MNLSTDDPRIKDYAAKLERISENLYDKKLNINTIAIVAWIRAYLDIVIGA